MSSPENESYIDPAILRTMTPEGRDMARRVLASSDLIITLESTGPDKAVHEEPSRFQRFKEFLGGLIH